MRQVLPVSIRLGGRAVSSSTLFVGVGAHVVVFSTTISSVEAPISLHSTYLGQRGSDTAATHLLLARELPESQLQTCTHPAGRMPVADDERHPCLYDHLQHLLAALRDLGHDPMIDVVDEAVEVVDR